MKTHTDENLYDYIHCRTSGYDILTPRIEAWMETLHIKDEPPVEESSEEASAEESTEASSVAPAESTAPAEDEGGIPVYVYIIIAVAAVAVIAAVVILMGKKK